MARLFPGLTPKRLFRKPKESEVSDLKVNLEQEYNNARELDRQRRWLELTNKYNVNQMTDSMYLESLRNIVDPISNPILKNEYESKYQTAKYGIIQHNQKIEYNRIQAGVKAGAISKQEAYNAYMALAKQSLASDLKKGILDAEVWKLKAVSVLTSGRGGGRGRGAGSSLDTQDIFSILKAKRGIEAKNKVVYDQIDMLKNTPDGEFISTKIASDGSITLEQAGDDLLHADGTLQMITPELRQNIMNQLQEELYGNALSLLDSSDYWKAIKSGGEYADMMESFSDSLISSYIDISGDSSRFNDIEGFEYDRVETPYQEEQAYEEAPPPAEAPAYEAPAEPQPEEEMETFGGKLKDLFQNIRSRLPKLSSAETQRRNTPLGPGTQGGALG